MLKSTKITIATIAIILTSLSLAVATSGILSSQQDLPANGTVTHSPGISVYTDQAATTNCTSVNWGSMSAETSSTKTIYVKNSGNTIETLHLATSDWQPSASSSIISLTWDKEGASLSAGSIVEARLTLSIGQDNGTIDNFNFNIIIEGNV